MCHLQTLDHPRHYLVLKPTVLALRVLSAGDKPKESWVRHDPRDTPEFCTRATVLSNEYFRGEWWAGQSDGKSYLTPGRFSAVVFAQPPCFEDMVNIDKYAACTFRI